MIRVRAGVGKNIKSAVGSKNMEKTFIQNRKGQKIAVIVEKKDNQKGLVFIMHGLGGFKEQPHIQAMTDVFSENNYTVIRFDTTNTLGESDGNFEDATTTNYYEDLEDVIKWSEGKTWYQEPFILVGHSLGGTCVALFAENHPEKVKALAPISTVVSGKLSFEIYPKNDLEDWRENGFEIRKSKSKPKMVKRLKWSHVADRLKYNLLPKVNKLTMPVLLIVGDKDKRTPLEHQKILYDALLGPKELHVIKGAPHTFDEQKHLKEIKQIFNQWIGKLK
jgi:pimeloyl-ACP methyl ester carboxylesterase